MSKWADVSSGIPQGSVPGPILFVIYINDLPNKIKSDICMFADDTKVFRTIKINDDQCIFRASKLKDHKIGGSPYLYETQSGDFLRELFKAEKQSATAAIMSCSINRTSVIDIDTM